MTERTPRGTFKSSVTVADVLELFDEIDGPVLGTNDIANHLQCTRATARKKLQALERRGIVTSRMVGRTKVFWLTDSSGDIRDWMGTENSDK